MNLETKTTKYNLSRIRINDNFELTISDGNKSVKTIVKIVNIPKEEEKCNSCGCLLKDEGKEYMCKLYCKDCLKREHERRSKIQMGHPRYGNEFNGNLMIMKK